MRARWQTALLALGAASLEVQRRPLTPAEAHTLVSQIARSPEITGYSIAEWTGGKDTFVLTDPGTRSILGAVLVHHLAFNWTEVAVVFILDEYRGLGLGNYMLASVLRTLEYGNRKLLLFFKKESMRQIVATQGFEIYNDQAEFCRRSVSDSLYIRFLYRLQWLSNTYRRKELRRKKKEFNTEFAFHLAFKAAKPISSRATQKHLGHRQLAANNFNGKIGNSYHDSSNSRNYKQ